ncbi:MAG: carboxypeptidase regulatory-like domain-containing protein [Acidobacteria bacterium]|nr:carboxypeptidase regulatory-like domain-containing protein [Acidobacteriota bacterium]
MKNIAVRSVAFSLAFSIFAVIGYSQGRNGVEGRIVDSNGDVVAGATLTVRHQDVRLVAKAVTDGEGRYSLTNMSDGKYDVTIGAIGFATLRSEMTIPSTQLVVFTITPGGHCSGRFRYVKLSRWNPGKPFGNSGFYRTDR